MMTSDLAELQSKADELFDLNDDLNESLLPLLDPPTARVFRTLSNTLKGVVDGVHHDVTQERARRIKAASRRSKARALATTASTTMPAEWSDGAGKVFFSPVMDRGGSTPGAEAARARFVEATAADLQRQIAEQREQHMREHR